MEQEGTALSPETASTEATTIAPTVSPSAPQAMVVQAKLQVGASDDKYEREADAVAADVVQAIRAGSGATLGSAQRVAQRAQRATAVVGAAGGQVDSDTHTRISRARGGGSALGAGTRGSMESAFGADFSNVRIHRGGESTALNDRIQAKAFTVGSDVFLRDSGTNVDAGAGQELLAHELTHTIQQGGAVQRSSAPAGRIQRAPQLVQRKAASMLLDSVFRSVHPADDTKVDETPTGAAGLSLRAGDKVDTDESKTLKGVASGAAYVAVTRKNGIDVSSHRTLYVLKSTLGYVGPPAASGSGAGAASDTISMFTGIAGAINALGDKHDSGKGEASSVSDTAGSVLTYGNYGTAVASAGAGGVNSLLDTAGSKDVSQGIAGFASAFTGIKDTFFVIKGIIDLANQASKMSDQERFKATMAIIGSSLSLAQSGISSAKAFLDVWGSGPGAAVVNAVPGFGIAICAVDIIVRAVDLVTSMVQRHDMQSRKRALKAKRGGDKGKSMKHRAKMFMSVIDRKREHGEAVTEQEEAEYDEYEEYLLAKGLQYISSKRARRAGFKIGVAMGKMAGDIAILGGASAPAGVGIKAGAMALDVGASGFRGFKQWGRDKAAKRRKSGAGMGAYGMFNADKSTKAKLADYNKMVDVIFKKIIRVVKIPDVDAQEAAASNVKAYINAMGLSLRRMNSLKEDPAKLRKAMIKSLKQRE